MDNLVDYLDFVNSQARFHLRQANRFKDDPRRFELHSTTSETFNSLAKAIENATSSVDEWSSLSDTLRINLTWDEIADLPEELIAELSISDSDKTDFNIISLINEAGGAASIDRIILSIFKQTGNIEKRSNLNARLYRMAQKELIYSVPGKKGVYSTEMLDEDDVKMLK